jgi:DNA-directed RNA polymerase subunit K/omega
MTEEKKTQAEENPENKYLSVLATSKRARQLLDRAEKHNLTVDTEKVVLQAFREFLDGKVTYVLSDAPPAKKKKKDE